MTPTDHLPPNPPTPTELRDWFQYLSEDSCAMPDADPTNRDWFTRCLTHVEMVYAAHRAILMDIAELMDSDPEEYSDGECMDAVADYLERLGIPVFPQGVAWRASVNVPTRDTDPTPPHGISRPDLGAGLLDLDEPTPSPFGHALD